MALNYETLIRAASKPPEQRTTTEINDFIFPWLKQSLKKKQGIFQKISDEVIHDICKSIMLERRPVWDVVIHQGDPGDTFYIILQGSVNIYRYDDDGPKTDSHAIDTVREFARLDADPDKREELIALAFGNYIVTLVAGFDFGERALVTDEPRSATVMTISPTDLLVVDREVFSRTLKTAHEKELQEKTDFINRCPIFSSWSARLKRLVSLSIERGRFAYDSMLYKQGTRADAVYFIWSGEVKLSMDPLLHWLQYPYLLSQSDPMKQRAMELFLPMLEPAQPANVHIPLTSNINDHRESYAIKRRHMTFAQAEKERAQRVLQLALLSAGDIVGLECYVCDLATHINSARCTAPCDLFYILKHNFLRLQKRHGTHGLGERLRETILLSLQAYPSRIIHLPLFTVLMKKQLAAPTLDDQQYYGKKAWLLRANSSNKSAKRRADASTYATGKDRLLYGSMGHQAATRPSRPQPLGSAVAVQFAVNDHIRVGKIEDRLKQWHAQMGEDSKTQIRALTRYSINPSSASDDMRTSLRDSLEVQSCTALGSSSIFGDANESNARMNLLMNAVNHSNEPVLANSPNVSSSSTLSLPLIRIPSKQERYNDVRAGLKQAWRVHLKRPPPSIF